MNTRAMFDYVKTVLENVSFDPILFQKELKKAIRNLLPYELEKLINWAKAYIKQKPELHESLYLIEST
ncbi:hypothetical protein [Myroides sp. LJL119]